MKVSGSRTFYRSCVSARKHSIWLLAGAVAHWFRYTRRGKREHRRNQCISYDRPRDRHCNSCSGCAQSFCRRLGRGPVQRRNLAALAVLLGHAFPVFLNFHGGKAVASFLGAYVYLAPLPVAAVAVVFFVTVWRTRYISLGSLLGAITFPLAVWIIQRPQHWPLLVCSILSCTLIVWRHRGNIERLRSGQENAFSLRRARA